MDTDDIPPLLAIPFALVALVLLLQWYGTWMPVPAHAFADPVPAAGEPVEQPASALPHCPVGDYRLRCAPSLSAAQIDAILAATGSPAAGTGSAWYYGGVAANIDPAYAVAFFIHESSAGTNPAWAGWKPDGSSTHNVGNIVCAGYATCYGRFRDYASWEEGINDWYRLIDDEYLIGRGHTTIADVLPVYAPSFENNVPGYVGAVGQLVDGWKQSSP